MERVHQGVVGVLGGMGSYVTLHVFERLLDAYRVEKEWERPRIVIDNRCTLPSRVRAILYNERREELALGIADSLTGLAAYQPDVVLLPCHTAHCFLPRAREVAGEAAARVVHMIELTVRHAAAQGRREVLVAATEGTIAAKIYDEFAGPLGIAVRYPDDAGQVRLRGFIEAVKQRRAPEPERFAEFLASFGVADVVLGCTELSVLYASAGAGATEGVRVIDPIGLIVGETVRRLPAAGA